MLLYMSTYIVEEETLTNGSSIACIAKRCIVKVANDPSISEYWARSCIGKARQAVEVLVNGIKKYIDNENGIGWLKITETPANTYRELKVDKVIAYLE